MAFKRVTLAELGASGRLIVVQCGRCPNRRLARPSDLDLPMNIAVSEAGALLRCCECGSKDVLTAIAMLGRVASGDTP